MPRIDLIDATFVVAPAAEVARRLRDARRWRVWWPDLRLTVRQNRAEAGIRWTVAGALTGSMEVWIQPCGDGVILHFFLRADPVEPAGSDVRRRPGQARDGTRQRVLQAKQIFWQLKDELEGDRPPGCGRPAG